MNRKWSLAVSFRMLSAFILVAASRDFISENMSADIERLSKHFNVTGDLTLFGNSIFLKHLIKRNGNPEETEQKLLIQEILDLYISILSNMKNRTEDSDIRRSIIHIRDRVKKLRNQAIQQKEHLLREQLQDLWAVQTSDSVVQRMAIRELEKVFQKVSELGIQT